MSDQLEDDLRDAFRQRAAELPDGVAARLRCLDYRPRSPRLAVAVTVGGVLGAAAVAGITVSLIGLGAGTQTAFAGWRASPTAPASGGQTAAAEAACLARVPNASDAERASNDGTLHDPVMEALLKIAPAEWHPVLVDTRGAFTTIILEAGKGQAQASCMTSPSSAVMSVGPVGGQAMPPNPGQAQVVSSGSQGAIAGHPFTYTEGRVGASVTGVTIVLNDGTHVSSTVANGHFLAWWPGTQHAVAEEVATSSETSTHSLENASPASVAPAR